MPDKMVIDASVAVKWYVPEIGSELAAAVLNHGAHLYAPDLLVAEFGNVLWKKVRKGELTQAEAEEIANAFTTTSPVITHPMTVFIHAALDIALRWNLTVYDALYVALAVDESCPLITADEKLCQALLGTELEEQVLSLSSLRS